MTASARGVTGMYKYHLKLLPLPSIALCALVIAVLPVIISFRFLAFQQVGTIGEMVMPLVGTLLLTPLAFREDGIGRREVLASSPTPYWRGFAVRLAAMALLTVLYVCLYIGIAALSANPFSWGAAFIGLLTTALTFGAIGLTAGHLWHNQALAYLLPMTCFAIEFFTKGKYTGRFYLLSLTEGALHPEKWVLLALAIALLAVNAALSQRQVKIG